MSRTYRRRKLRADRDCYWDFKSDHEAEWAVACHPEGKPMDVRTEASKGSWLYKREVAIFHKDGRNMSSWCYSVPSWFCHMKDKPKKRHNKAEVRKLCIDPDYEPNFIPFKRDAKYDYF